MVAGRYLGIVRMTHRSLCLLTTGATYTDGTFARTAFGRCDDVGGGGRSDMFPADASDHRQPMDGHGGHVVDASGSSALRAAGARRSPACPAHGTMADSCGGMLDPPSVMWQMTRADHLRYPEHSGHGSPGRFDRHRGRWSMAHLSAYRPGQCGGVGDHADMHDSSRTSPITVCQKAHHLATGAWLTDHDHSRSDALPGCCR